MSQGGMDRLVLATYVCIEARRRGDKLSMEKARLLTMGCLDAPARLPLGGHQAVAVGPLPDDWGVECYVNRTDPHS